MNKQSLHCGLIVSLLSLLAFDLPAAPPIRVMPVGDSITRGSSTPGGYRLPLYQMLTSAGYNVDFVGLQTDNSAAALPDPDHEGHGGWRIDQIDSIIEGVFDSVADPDVILLLIGTNDFGQNYDTPNATNRLDALIAKMAAARPFAKIVVANLLKRGEPQDTAIQTSFNPAVPGLVANHYALGREVYFTDLRSDLTLADTYDNLHPNATGYAKMATNWFGAVTNLFTPVGSANPPHLYRARGFGGSTNVTVTFSKPVTAASATNTANYALSGGIAIHAAVLDPVSERDVTLVTDPLAAGVSYTLTVNDIFDQTPANNMINPDSTVAFFSTVLATRGVFNNVAEASEYTMVYSLDIPTASSFNTSAGPAYDVDLRTAVSNYSRVAYYLELQKPGGSLDFIWVGVDAFTTNASKIGVPCNPGGPIFQQSVSNLTVLSNVAGIPWVTNAAGGHMEFWPWNYNASNVLGVANASHTAYDWGDMCSTNSGNYGSMQIHLPVSNLVLFAYNNWGGNGNDACLGIGNNTGSSNPDWTFMNNAAQYSLKSLQVLVLPAVNTNAPSLLWAKGAPGRTNVVLQFSEPLDDDATNLAHYAIAGLAVTGASLDPYDKTRVTLDTPAQAAGALYAVTASGLSDRTSAHAVMAAPGNAVFVPAAAGRGALANLSKAAGYTMAFSIDLPAAARFNSTGALYQVDNRPALGDFDRVAFYLELQKTGGELEFAWVEMDPYTADPMQIGIPDTSIGRVFQQPVTNLFVASTVPTVTSGDFPSGGNMEFWYCAYNAVNVAGVPGASDTAYDWGDRPTNSGGYGSMQVHNAALGQVLLAVNNWGGGGTVETGIGNNFTGSHPDWTFSNNSGQFTIRSLQAWVRPVADAEPPALLSAASTPDRLRLVLTFSEPLADNALDLSNYGLSGGVTVLSAAFGADRREVVLTTSEQPAAGGLTLSVSGVRDNSPAANLMAPVSGFAVLRPAAPARIADRAPEATNFVVACRLEIPVVSPGWNDNGTVYDEDNRTAIGAFDRVAYYMELVTTNSPATTNWVFVSMDPFTTDPMRIGVPDRTMGVYFQRPVTNLNVVCNVPGVTNGTGLLGHLEFWPFDYAAANQAAVSNASASLYDWGDQVNRTTLGFGGYGSMQVHVPVASNVVFAYNRWGSANTYPNTACVGIGNQPVSQPDWTHADNAAHFASRTLYVLVRPAADAAGPALVAARGSTDRTKVMVSFDEPLSGASANPANFTIDGGVSVMSAVLQPNLRDILLTTSAHSPGTLYTVTVSNVTDRTAAANPAAPGSTASFTAVTTPSYAALVPESADYELVYQLAIPSSNPNWNANPVAYAFDQRKFVTRPFDRMAWFLELSTNSVPGATNWIWTSFNAVTKQLNRTGVPSIDTGAGWQARVSSLNVLSSVAGLVSGTNLGGGNLEWYPYNYGAGTNSGVTGGSHTAYDWNDSFNSGAIGHGAMQVHYWQSNKVLFAVNHWGNGAGGVTELGIGNQATGNPDWTFANNGTNYLFRNLFALVRTYTPDAPAVAPPVVAQSPVSRTNQLGESTTLAAQAAGGLPMTYQWRLNGSPLPGRTNSWLNLAGLQTADQGGYDVVIANGGGAATSLVAAIEVNRPPSVPLVYAGTVQGQSASLGTAVLLGAASDPDGDPLSLAGAAGASTNGATVASTATNVLYTPVGGFAGTDRFDFHVADTRGGAATGVVQMIVVGADAYNRITSAGAFSGGAWQLQYQGLPPNAYDLQRSTNLVDWTTFTNLPAGPDGILLFADPNPPDPRGFYRVWKP